MFIFRFLRKFIVLILVFVVGAAAGGYAVTKFQPRSFLNVKNCQNNCFKTNELLGLLGSVGMQYTPNLIPGIIVETDKAIAIKHPRPATPVHYVIIPKRDIKNIAELEEGDQEYIDDVMAVIGELVRRDNLKSYRVITNGPGYQSVAYLHFHLMGK
jgi:histidine triad (HIT) family protein